MDRKTADLILLAACGADAELMTPGAAADLTAAAFTLSRPLWTAGGTFPVWMPAGVAEGSADWLAAIVKGKNPGPWVAYARTAAAQFRAEGVFRRTDRLRFEGGQRGPMWQSDFQQLIIPGATRVVIRENEDSNPVRVRAPVYGWDEAEHDDGLARRDLDAISGMLVSGVTAGKLTADEAGTQHASVRLTRSNGEPPTVSELARELDTPRETVNRRLKNARRFIRESEDS
ncbi:MAG TPA: hypothetical protein VKM54_24480 [Myxococcota bacterium]|nr:hypothetical protein [Myxococcota bacterium]